ncbi:beta-ketoacyl-ACP synthase 3 [Streptomyces sp. So13.3]|uniref:beta-ketoacyl-ACP synthase 3 n=1 Tax=Streptomyces TaxID=1883 RepID=UPI001105ADBA|nr:MULTISPECIES: beta-ketoacyl-ACP synthase 3 [unclassified Streptomyces]MCZ4101602.1 beta-ketoacyl-ACP synthase 3 [Streptomyces sp. H39-C1]QNA76353.1 beta-ketoacyl-ACP synthase 3 [Streptomyces sp. So13.3]
MTRAPRAVTAPNAAILGVGAYRPARVLDNDELCQVLDAAGRAVVLRSGIRSRRRAAPSESLAAMAHAASAKALASAGFRPGEVDHIIVTTMSRPGGHPPVSSELAQRLPTRRATISDISAVCAGFTSALALARNAVVTEQARCVLVVGTERMLDIVDPRDRSTAALFGDGAGAMVVGPSRQLGIGPVSWRPEESERGLASRGEAWVSLRSQATNSWPYLRMDGTQVFRWAMSELPQIAQTALDLAEVKASELDAFIPHQANQRIVDGIARALNLPRRVAIARDLVEMGDTSAASIPMAMEELLASGKAPAGGLALLLGFGAGLAHAAQVVRLP